jgi:hypothetical protein
MAETGKEGKKQRGQWNRREEHPRQMEVKEGAGEEKETMRDERFWPFAPVLFPTPETEEEN